MSERWLILADDLTGAADSAIAFAKRGADTFVTWEGANIADAQMHTVVAYNAASREMSALDSVRVHRAALDRWLASDINLYKKIDSTLRGHPVAEIGAVRAFMRSRGSSGFGILAPAYPALGRTTHDGRVYVNGQPLEETEVWSRDHSYSSADLVRILASEDIDATGVSIDTIRGGIDTMVSALNSIARTGAIAVCDALTHEDLLELATAIRGLDVVPFFAGSGGFAQALAETRQISRHDDPPVQLLPSGQGALIVVGSVASASRAAARQLVADQAIRHMPLAHELVLGDVSRPECRAFARAVTQALTIGDDVLVEIQFDGRPEAALVPQLVEGLAKLLGPCALQASGIAATGGETASALLRGMQVDGLRLLEEIEPGICLGITVGEHSIPVVTKAGAFGDQHSLFKMTERLRTMRQTGLRV